MSQELEQAPSGPAVRTACRAPRLKYLALLPLALGGLTIPTAAVDTNLLAPIDEAVRLSPKDPYAFRNRAFFYYEQNHFEEAIKDYTQAIHLDRENARFYEGRAAAYQRLNQWEKADQDHAAAIRVAPQDPLAYYSRGEFRAESGSYDEALDDYTQAIRLDPRRWAFYKSRGWAYARSRKFDQALSDYDAAIRLAPDGQKPYLIRGLAYAAKGLWPKALEDYDAEARLYGTNSFLCRWRGYAYFQIGDYAAALRDYAEASRHANTPSAESWAERVQDEFAKYGSWDTAIRAYSSGLRLQPQVGLFYRKRGLAYAAKGDWDRAAADWHSALQLDPIDARAFDHLAWLRATCPEPSRRNGSQAVAAARIACQLVKGERWQCLRTLAAAQAEAGSFAEAVQSQKEALAKKDLLANERAGEEARLTLYQRQKPYHDSPGSDSPK